MKILFLQKRILFPANTGGQIRTLNILRHLARWHDVTYLCNVQEADEPYLHQMRELGVQLETIPWREIPRNSWRFYRDLASNLLSPYPFTVAKDFDPRLRARAEALIEQQPFDLLICDFVQMARNAIGLRVTASLLLQHNVESQIFERHASHGQGWLRRKYMGLQWYKMRRFESRAGNQFTAVVAVSDQDRHQFEREYGWRNVHTIDTAVDVQYFSPNGHHADGDRVVFLGSMDWLPNQDAARYFVEQIWSKIQQVHPQARFQIVGRNPDASVQNLAGVDGVEVLGTVPDVRPFLSQASVVVVPLLVGGGTRIKIFEAMAMGRPVVSTSLGAEGLKVNPDEHLVLADDPDAFASAVNRLLSDRGSREQIGKSARTLVCDRFSAETVARQFEKICTTLQR